MYYAHNWVILKVNSEEPFYKVLAQVDLGLNGWRLNSGIVEIQDCGEDYKFIGASGSYYVCPKDAQEISQTTSEVLAVLPKGLELVDFDSIDMSLIK